MAITMRNPYIRFFISSTFADMAVERNALRELFGELNDEYSRKGWQVEFVDLRWSITHEAALDNRTVRICLDELGRCMAMSPKPNFIVLTGQRYGWIPLPETLTVKELEDLRKIADDIERQLLDEWYKVDENQLPEPVAVLQPRTGLYEGDFIWENMVYNQLRELFKRSGIRRYNLSATEIEINHGAISVPDAREHVVVYHRNLSGIPQSEETIYKDNCDTEIENVVKNLKSTAGKDNILEVNANYADYISADYAKRFKTRIGGIIRRVIDKAIRESTVARNESDRHAEIAEAEAKNFFGRHEELSEIDRYISDKARNKALIIHGQPGTGKSTLMAKIAEKYKSSHKVICRFCGETPESSSGPQLFRSIWRAIVAEKGQPRNLPSFSEEVEENYYMTQADKMRFSDSEILNVWLRKFDGKGRPVLIIVDGVNQLEGPKSEEFKRLSWASGDLGQGVKVIVTTTDARELREKFSSELRELDKDEALEFVQTKMAEKSRRLTNAQLKQVERLLASSDRRPIYLTLLADYLCRFTSSESLGEISGDFDSLTDMVLSSVAVRGNHDERFISRVMSLFAAERKGFSHQEISEVCAHDTELVKSLQSSSFHEFSIDESHPMLPAIFWSRLYPDISFFFKTRHLNTGTMLTIRHGEFLRSISNKYFADKESQLAAYSILSDYYSSQSNKHAQSELAYQLYCQAVLRINTGLDCRDCYEKLNAALHDASTIHTRVNIDREELLEDYDNLLTLSKYSSGCDERSILRLKREVSSLRKGSWKNFLAQGLSMPTTGELWEIAAAESDIPGLGDEIGMKTIDDATMYSTPRQGWGVCISDDGLKLASIKDGKLHFDDLLNPNLSFEQGYNEKVIGLTASADLDKIFLLFDSGLLVVDSQTKKSVNWTSAVKNGSWVTASADGEKYAYGNGNDMWLSRKDGCYESFGESKLSNTGRTMWSVNDDLIVTGIDTGTMRIFGSRRFSADKDDISKLGIITVSDTMCVLSATDKTANWTRLIFLLRDSDGANQTGVLYYECGMTVPAHIFEARGWADDDSARIFVSNGKALEISREGKELQIDRVTTAYMPEAISCNGEYGYGNCTVVNAIDLFDNFGALSAFNVGVNTLSVSHKGDFIAVTKGVNQLQEHGDNELLMYTDDNGPEVVVLKESRSSFLQSCSISPDGKQIWISEFETPSGANVFIADNECNVKQRTHTDRGFITMPWTDDGKFVVACEGHYIANYEPIIWIFGRDGHLVRKFNADGGRGLMSFMGHAVISADNRYLINGGEDVVDLVEGKLLFSLPVGEAAKNECTDRSDMLFLTALSPQGVIYCGRKAYTMQGKCIGAVSKYSVIACSASGNMLFARDEKHNLYLQSKDGRTGKMLAENVNMVIPTFKEKFFFVQHTDDRVVLMNTAGEELAHTFLPRAFQFRMTERGLAAVTGNGKAVLWRLRQPEYESEPFIASTTRKWNLETKTLENHG